MRLLDLFCKAGGAGFGYHLAGFEVTGVDIMPQRHYPFDFIQADALEVDLSGFDVIHASPPCQRFSQLTTMHGPVDHHEDLVDLTRQRLIDSGLPFIIENVPAAPLRNPILLCGSMFGLKVRRHRIFEISGFNVPQPECKHDQQGKVVGVYGHSGGKSNRDGKEFNTKDV